jgi:hypothetical protein
MQSMSLKKILAAGGALVVLGVAAVGLTVVQAQTAPTPTPNAQRQDLRTRYTEALANRLRVSVDQLKQAMIDARQDVGLPDPAARPAPGPGRRGPGGPGGFGSGFGGPGGMRGFLGAEADAVATLFKEDRAALLNEMPGKTLAEIASAHGISTQDLVNTILKRLNDQIDRMAQARNHSAEQVSQMKQRTSERVQEFVTTHRFPARGTGSRS